MAHPLAQPGSPTSAGWAPTLPPPLPVTEYLLDALPQLAMQGRWREVAKRCRLESATDTSAAMTVAAYHLLALIKLNMLDVAAAELAKLGKWDDCAASQQGESAAAGGSVPFALRRIRADLPWWLGRQKEAVDRLYQLLEYCAAQEAAAASTAAAQSGPSSGGGVAEGGAVRLWRRRHRDVLLLLVNKHSRLQQFVPALRLLDGLLARDPDDVGAWQEAAMVQAQLGDAQAATATLQRVEGMLQQPGAAGGAGQEGQQQAQRRQQEVHRNKGLACFLQQDYRGAAREYQAALSLEPADAAAASNLALALMFANRLPEATASLEAAFQRAPAAMLQEPIVANLAAMLELGASPASLAAKQRMADWVSTNAPDDFDLSAIRTPGAA